MALEMVPSGSIRVMWCAFHRLHFSYCAGLVCPATVLGHTDAIEIYLGIRVWGRAILLED